MPSRSRFSGRAMVIGALSLVVVGLAAALLLWPDDDDVRVAQASEATTTTTTEATTTTRPTTTTETTTTTTAPTTTSPPPTTSQPPPPTTAAPPPAYRSSIETVSAAQLRSSWKPDMGCPDPSTLRAVNVTHWRYDGGIAQGRIIVAASQAQNVAAIFGDLYGARFPIHSIVPIDRYDADDQASMRANNTSGFNCRTVAGSTTLSQHGLGLAIDVNPLHNPYVKNGTVDPPEGATWADRSRNDPGMIKPGPVVDAFAARGWKWGGYWSSGQDYQHFSTSGR